MNTTRTVRDLLSQAFTQSVIALNNRATKSEDQQTFSGIYLGNNRVRLPNGDERTAYNQGTKEVLQGEPITVVFALHSMTGVYTSKIS